jgi:hypothetical protein
LNSLSTRFGEFFSYTDLKLASAVHPRFKLDWLDESDPSEKSIKEAITIKLQNQMAQLVPGSMSMAKWVSPDEPKDFYSSLKKTHIPAVADPIKIELTRFFEENNTGNLQVLHGAIATSDIAETINLQARSLDKAIETVLLFHI